MTDADTIANAGDLWALAHMVQETIDKDGMPMHVDEIGSGRESLAQLRRMADDLDPENGRF